MLKFYLYYLLFLLTFIQKIFSNRLFFIIIINAFSNHVKCRDQHHARVLKFFPRTTKRKEEVLHFLFILLAYV